MNGFITLQRKLVDWEWWNDHNTSRLFIYLLLTVNWEDKNWQGIVIKRGSIVTSYSHLATETGISVQSVRTSLDRLKSTHEVTIKTTNKYTHISVNKYDEYQQVTSKVTINQQTTNKQLTTTEQYNNNNKSNTKVLETKVVPQKNTYIECLLKEFETLFGFPPTDKKPRFVAQAFRKNIEKFLKVFNPEITQDRFDRVVKEYFNWISTQDYAENIQKLEAIKLKFPIWSTPKVTSYQKGNHANHETKE